MYMWVLTSTISLNLQLLDVKLKNIGIFSFKRLCIVCLTVCPLNDLSYHIVCDIICKNFCHSANNKNPSRPLLQVLSESDLNNWKKNYMARHHLG